MGLTDDICIRVDCERDGVFEEIAMSWNGFVSVSFLVVYF